MAIWEWREVAICETFLRGIINGKFIRCGYQEEQRVKEDSQVSGLEQLKAIFFFFFEMESQEKGWNISSILNLLN